MSKKFDQEGFDESSSIREEDRVILADEDGNAETFVILALAQLDNREFGLLAYEDQLLSDSDEEMEVLILEREAGEENDIWRGVEDDIYEEIQAFFTSLLDTPETSPLLMHSGPIAEA